MRYNLETLHAEKFVVDTALENQMARKKLELQQMDNE